MGTELPDNQNLTVESCIDSCIAQNFTAAGLEFSVQCCKYIVLCCLLAISSLCFKSAAMFLLMALLSLPIRSVTWDVVQMQRKF
jgi:hypothetical protein